jgi:hypothetical protein
VLVADPAERNQMELGQVAQWLRGDEPKTVEELERVAAELARHGSPHDLETATARMRIAVRLEQLGR